MSHLPQATDDFYALHGTLDGQYVAHAKEGVLSLLPGDGFDFQDHGKVCDRGGKIAKSILIDLGAPFGVDQGHVARDVREGESGIPVAEFVIEAPQS